MGFAPSFYEHLSDRLELAVYDLNQEHRMSVFDMTQALSDVPTPATVPANPFPEKPKMGITGLQSGLIEAKLAQVKQRAQDRLNQGLAKIDTAQEAGLAKVDAAMDGVIAKIEAEVDNQLQEFATATNGGPA